MIRAIALCALSLALASCATRSASPPPAVEQPKPQAVDVRICADVVKVADLPAEAGIPLAVTPEERSALDAFLTWVATLVDHDRVMTERAELARRQACNPR